MKKTLKYLSFVLFLGAVACNESNEADERQSVKDTVVTTEPTKDSGKELSKSFQNLLKSPQGLIRGVSLGMSMPEVKKLEESTQLDEEKSNQLDYMVNYAELEEAEINYLFNEYNRVSTIEVNIYPKNAASQDSIFMEVEKYYNEKFGNAPTLDSNSRKWENKPENTEILLEKRGNKKIHDINIRYSGLKGKA